MTYQLLPPLSEKEYEELKADIAQHGILVPVEKDENGETLDGYHRLKAFNELREAGIKVPDYPVLIRVGLTEEEKRNHVRRLNLLRRHLTKAQLKEQRKAMRADGMTYQAIAEASGVGTKTVQRQLVDSQLSNDNSPIKTKRGQKRPAKYKPRTPKTVIATTRVEEKKAMTAIAEAGGALPDKVVYAKRAGRIGREVAAKEKRQSIQLPVLDPSIDLRVGDFQEKLQDLAQESVDLICTDPPYGKAGFNLWKELAVFANRVLKPGGWLTTYSGQAHLEQIIPVLASELTYVWVIAQVNTSAAKNIFYPAHIYSRWKPILLFAKPPINPLNWVDDLIQGGGKDKSLHDWQQSEAEAIYCIENFSLPGQLVVDPFLGSGTTAVAAKRACRHFIGCDIDPANISKAIERLQCETKNGDQT